MNSPPPLPPSPPCPFSSSCISPPPPSTFPSSFSFPPLEQSLYHAHPLTAKPVVGYLPWVPRALSSPHSLCCPCPYSPSRLRRPEGRGRLLVDWCWVPWASGSSALQLRKGSRVLPSWGLPKTDVYDPEDRLDLRSPHRSISCVPHSSSLPALAPCEMASESSSRPPLGLGPISIGSSEPTGWVFAGGRSQGQCRAPNYTFFSLCYGRVSVTECRALFCCMTVPCLGLQHLPELIFGLVGGAPSSW